MAQSETVERILDAAEQLFAEKGFAETSLRLITSKAGVNLAAVNYHFGSKKALIQAVFSRFLGPFCISLDRELERRQAKPENKPSLEDLLEILVEQALVVQPRSGNDLSIFMRLLGLAFSQSQGHLRRYLEDMYGKVFRRYMLLVNEAAPRIPPIELFWRHLHQFGQLRDGHGLQHIPVDDHFRTRRAGLRQTVEPGDLMA
jgi:AcrR family transcriptional regulator